MHSMFASSGSTRLSSVAHNMVRKSGVAMATPRSIVDQVTCGLNVWKRASISSRRGTGVGRVETDGIRQGAVLTLRPTADGRDRRLRSRGLPAARRRDATQLLGQIPLSQKRLVARVGL